MHPLTTYPAVPISYTRAGVCKSLELLLLVTYSVVPIFYAGAGACKIWELLSLATYSAAPIFYTRVRACKLHALSLLPVSYLSKLSSDQYKSTNIQFKYAAIPEPEITNASHTLIVSNPKSDSPSVSEEVILK